MENQEIFDIVKNHLLTQGKKSLLSEELRKIMHERDGYSVARCAYRGEDNCKCAFGVLISDEDYNIEMEGKLASIIIFQNSSLNLKYENNVKLILLLQSIHDNTEPSSWEFELSALAENWGFKYE